MILKAAMPIGAAQKTGLPFLAAIAISCILVHVFRSVKVFLVLATLSTFRRSCRKRLLLGLISLV
jgi:hypothetical protein